MSPLCKDSRLDLDEYLSVGIGELAASRQRADGVAANSDVAVEDEDGGPPALHRHRPEDVALDHGRTLPAGQGDGCR